MSPFIEKHPVLWIHMMTSSNGNIFHVTGPLWWEFIGHRWIPLTKASAAELWCFFYLRPNKRQSKHSRRWWFETPLRWLWPHCNGQARLVPAGSPRGGSVIQGLCEAFTSMTSHECQGVYYHQPATRLFVQQHVTADNIGNREPDIIGPLWGESTGHQWNPLTKGL